VTERHRIGLLVPSSDIAMEADLWRRLPPHLTLHVARMYLETTNVAAEEKMLDEELAPAARMISSVSPELVIFGCTSASALRGLDGEETIVRLTESIAGCPCVTVTHAALFEIRLVAPRRLLLVTPYIAELSSRLEKTFLEAGLPVKKVVGMGLDDDLDIGAVTPEEIHTFVATAVRSITPAPDCVFVSCTTFRSFEAAEGLEQDLGIPIVTSNRSVFKAVVRQFGEG
jgi:maleate isomerase